MSLLWQTKTNNKLYQVKTAGTSIRLYTNGVFHSQYNPNRPLSGNIWDLLILPTLFSPECIKHILILGLGGGAAVLNLRHFFPESKITALEFDSTHIKVSKDFFGVKPDNKTKVIKQDAIAWLKEYKGEKFDFILDDLFIDVNGDPSRATKANLGWTKHLMQQLSSKGVLAINYDSRKNLQASSFLNPRYNNLFKTKLSLSCPGYENRILALFKTEQQRQYLRANLSVLEKKTNQRLLKHLNASIRTI